MVHLFRHAGLMLGIALRNLTSHRQRTLLVGSILAIGTALVLVGLSLLDSIEASMSASITESLSGQLQVYSSDNREELSLFGGGLMGIDDIGRIDHFDRAAEVVRSVPEVEAVVPMGLDFAAISNPGALEAALQELRTAVYDEDGATVRASVPRVRELVQDVADELTRRREIAARPEDVDEALADAHRATTDTFWSDFDQDPLAKLEFLDTRVAPESMEGQIIYFRYLGTDIPRFTDHFDRFRLVDGEVIPPRTRGLMFNQKFYEQQIKHHVARLFDRVHRMVTQQELSLATDDLLRTIAARMPTQWRRVAYDLTTDERALLLPRLQAYLPDVEPELGPLLQALLTVDDDNVLERYAWFYEHVVPLIDLYDVDIGETVTIRTFTRSGFLKAVNVRMFGVFKFEGLDGSDLAGSHNLMDMMTFRELYGLMTPGRVRELDELRASVGVEDIDRDQAELAMFGGDAEVLTDVEADQAYGSFDEFADLDLSDLRGRSEAVFDESFLQADLDRGMALNMAVVLEPGADLAQAKRDVAEAIESSSLPLQVVSWNEAAGVVGQFIVVIRVVLYIALAIIFAVALVIINNSTVTATLERIPEIGTMRAIGAQRGTVLGIFFTETVALSVLAGTLGVLVGGLLLTYLGQAGIPAWHQVLFFLFGGPRLYPSFGPQHVLWALGSVTVITAGSALYPAFLAASVQPVEAMRDKD
jgi:ABC-type lipoprotein release transport system permease subunit